MANPTEQWSPISKKEMTTLEKYPEFQEGRDLLTKELIINTVSGPKRLRITQFEPFTGMKQPSHQAAFEAKSRQPGEFFILWNRGIVPMLCLVVDSSKGSIVWIREANLDGERVSAQKLIAELGLDRKNFPQGSSGATLYRNAVDGAVDGQDAHDKSNAIRIEAPRKPEDIGPIEIRKLVAQRAENSLGVFANVAHYNQALREAAATDE